MILKGVQRVASGLYDILSSKGPQSFNTKNRGKVQYVDNLMLSCQLSPLDPHLQSERALSFTVHFLEICF